MSYSQPPSCNRHGKRFLLAYILNQLDAKSLLQNQLLLRILSSVRDSALSLCTVGSYYVYDVTKT